jgi:hypothetical protein
MSNVNKGFTLRNVAVEAAIADVQKDYAKESGTMVSQHIMTIAKTFPNVDGFLAACSIEEDFLKSPAGMQTVLDAFRKEGIKEQFSGNCPRAWSQAKSNIKKAWQLGINPSDHETESSMRAELNKKRNEKKNQSAGGVIETELANLGKAIKMLDVAGQQRAIDDLAALKNKYYDAAKALAAAQPKDKTEKPVEPTVIPKAQRAKVKKAKAAPVAKAA